LYAFGKLLKISRNSKLSKLTQIFIRDESLFKTNDYNQISPGPIEAII